MTSEACCTGHAHPGEPRGKTEKVHGLNAYITEPSSGSSPKAILVMVPDAFGWEFVNLRLLADTFADRLGVRFFIPDFMVGAPASLSGLYGMQDMSNEKASYWTKITGTAKAAAALAPFMYRNRFGVVWPVLEPFFQKLRESTELPIGVIGYCWGGKHAVVLANNTTKTPNGKPLIDAAYTAHPSNLTIPGEIDKLELPILFSQGTKDAVLPMAQVKQIQDIFAKKNEADKASRDPAKGERYVIKVVENAKHSFAVRGDPNDKEELAQAQIAEDQAVEWFSTWLLGSKA